jgi:hypothetical protein
MNLKMEDFLAHMVRKLTRTRRTRMSFFAGKGAKIMLYKSLFIPTKHQMHYARVGSMECMYKDLLRPE